MSRPQEPHRPFFQFGNPFRMISHRRSEFSPKLLPLLNYFEEALAQRMNKLKPTEKSDVLSLSWMKLAMESIYETYNSVKNLIAKLELPVSDWDEQWIKVYLDVSVKLLDVCNAFNSELSRFNQGHLYLQYAQQNLESTSPEHFSRARSSIDGWRKHINAKNPKLESCWTILEGLVSTLDLPKVKNSSKGKILMRAIHGFKMFTVFVCSIFASTFSGSDERLFNLTIDDTYLWAQSFKELQSSVNTEIRNLSENKRPIVLKELASVEAITMKVYPLIQEKLEVKKAETLEGSVAEFKSQTRKFLTGIDLLTKEMDGFFMAVLTGRDALLSNLREEGGKASPKAYGKSGQIGL